MVLESFVRGELGVVKLTTDLMGVRWEFHAVTASSGSNPPEEQAQGREPEVEGLLLGAGWWPPGIATSYHQYTVAVLTHLALLLYGPVGNNPQQQQARVKTLFFSMSVLAEANVGPIFEALVRQLRELCPPGGSKAIDELWNTLHTFSVVLGWGYVDSVRRQCVVSDSGAIESTKEHGPVAGHG